VEAISVIVNRNSGELTPFQLLVLVSYWENLLTQVASNNSLVPTFLNIGQRFFSATSRDVLIESQVMYNTTARIISNLEMLLDVVGLDDSGMYTFTSENQFVLSTELVHKESYAGSNFSHHDSTIILPRDILNVTSTRLAFSFYYLNNITSALFYSPTRSLQSSVISARLTGQSVTNTQTPVRISFTSILPPSNDTDPTGLRYCTYWNFTSNDWSTSGCITEHHNSSITCTCNHLTHFAITQLPAPPIQATPMPVPVETQILEAVSVGGAGISVISIIAIIITHISSKMLRQRSSSKLLVNLSFSLLLLYLTYIGAVYSKIHLVACIVFSYVFHYAILVVMIASLGQIFSLVFKNLNVYYPLCVFIASWCKQNH
jgi:hypothetical protein